MKADFSDLRARKSALPDSVWQKASGNIARHQRASQGPRAVLREKVFQNHSSTPNRVGGRNDWSNRAFWPNFIPCLLMFLPVMEWAA
jgi:hypothetical protein